MIPLRTAVWMTLLCATLGHAQTRVTAVRFWSLGDVTRVAIETNAEVNYHTEHLTEPERIFFDLAGVLPQAGKHGIETIPVDDKLLKQIRIARSQPTVTRIVLDLASPVEHTISQLSNPDRIIVELRVAGQSHVVPPARSVTGSHNIPPPDGESSPPPKPVAPPSPPELRLPPKSGAVQASTLPDPPRLPPDSRALPAPPRTVRASVTTTPPPAEVAKPIIVAETKPPVVAEAKPPKPEPRPALESATAAQRDSHGSRSLIRALGLKLERVVIDPGHGGHDTGTIGPGGTEEKALVLDVAKRLGTLISQRLGSEVIYTRADDTFIPLEERTQIANDRHADLFLSIHANSSRLVSISGSETFYLNLTTSPAALEVAARENASSQKSVYELQSLVQKITLSEKVQESREFAGIVQKALYAGIPRNRVGKNRGVKQAPFVVLIGAKMPSVLAEVAFLSNPKDEAQLKKPEYRQKVAEALYRGVSQYARTLSHFQVAASAE